MSNQNQTVTRGIETLEKTLAFSGERLVIDKTHKWSITGPEAIRLGVSLWERGETVKGRGAFVIAQAASAIKDEKEAKAFMDLLKAECVNSAKEKALASLPAGSPAQALEAAKEEGVKSGEQRYQNMGQTIRAAKWLLLNPGKVADSVSIFTVQQVNAFLEAPAKEDKEAGKKEAVRAAVLPLLAQGVTQPKVKEAVKAAKEAFDKAAEEGATLTAEQKSEQEAKAREADKLRKLNRVRAELLAVQAAWDAAVEAGWAMEDIRGLPISHEERSKGTLTDLYREIGKSFLPQK